MLLYKPNAVLGIRSRSHFFYQCRIELLTVLNQKSRKSKPGNRGMPVLESLGSEFQMITLQSRTAHGGRW